MGRAAPAPGLEFDRSLSPAPVGAAGSPGAEPPAAGLRAALTGRRALALAAVVVGLAVVHAAVVGGHYFVGSFDDDAGYIVVARALAHGQGLTSRLAAGYPLVSTYPPGYGALLAPIARIDGTAFLAFRALSVVALVALLPLVWSYLGRRRVGDPARLAVLLLLALNPVLATFSTMVMAELPFLVALLVLLLAVERWEASPRVMTWAGAATVVAAAASVWLKEAAIGLVAGLVVWLALRRLWRKAAVAAGGTAVLFAPVILARLIVGGSLIGSRYATEFGAAFAGGIGHQVTSAIPNAVATYLNSAIPQSIVPTSVSPLPVVGPVAGLLGTLGTTVTPLVLIGLVVWWHRHRDAAAVMVPVYVVTTLAYPFVNERRLIIVLPVIVAWYVLGAGAVIKAVIAAGRWFGREMAGRLVAWAPALVVIAVLVPQFGRDYLYALGQDSSRPQGSPYMAMLHDLGPPSEVVESDFLWSTNLFSGHPTAESAYLVAVNNCYAPELYKAIEQDGAGLVLTGALSNIPGVGSPCLLQALSESPGAVRLLRTARDDASVFELVGPGSPHPTLSDATAGAAVGGTGLGIGVPGSQAPGDAVGTFPVVVPVDGTATVTWTWSRPEAVDQVSVGAAGALSGTTGGVEVDLRGTDGRWRAVVGAPGGVGDAGATPYLLAQLSRPVPATALRVRVRAGGPVAVVDAHALATPA